MKKGSASKETFVEWASNIACNDTIKNMIWATQASYALSRKNMDFFEDMYSKIESDYTYLLDRLMLEYQRTWASMSNPEVVSASITDKPTDINNGMPGFNNNLLSQIIASNAGKVTYIDIGALWCRPCLEILEHIKTLRDEYAGKEVDFSLICMDGKEEEWQKALLENGLNEVPNHLTTHEEEQFLRDKFGMFSIPFGILVNKKGIIVDYGTHVRPGMELRAKIDHLLEHDKLAK
jgi:thiol-disulfide isomerase/thioredoxin